MPGPNKRWEDEEEESSSSGPGSPPVGPVRRGKFDDEEEGDDDVLDSWDADEDSEVEREKAKKAAEAKAKAEAEAAAKKKSKAERIAERQAERTRALASGYTSVSAAESDAERRERLRQEEKEADLRHAEDLFAGVGISGDRKAAPGRTMVSTDAKSGGTVNLATLPLFNPATKAQFDQLSAALVPLVGSNAKKPHYVPFLQELAKQLAQDLPSEQIKKLASTLTSLSNEKMKQEKAAEKGGKKSKAAKTKASLAGVSRNPVADMSKYDDAGGEDYGDDDFM